MTERLTELLAIPGFAYAFGAVWFMLGSVTGFLTSRFTRTKAEGDLQRQRLYDNGERLVREKDAKYQTFVGTMQKVLQKETSELTLEDFIELSSAADLYFSELRNIANACLSANVTASSRDNNFVPAMRDAVNTSLPKYYEVLPELAKGLGTSYDGELKRENYESIYLVVEKFDNLAPLRSAA